MSDKAAKVIAIALGEVGYKEKATNADLDLATANAGTGNWTKYARDLWNAGYYNGNKNGYPWCDVFVDWCFFKAFGKTEGQLLECQTGDLGAAVPYSAGYYKAKGQYDTTPRVGDQIFYQQGGALVHTGIVVELTDTQVTAVEGNTSNMVAKRTYSRTDSYIAGYGHPDYGDATGGDTPTPAPAPAPAGGSVSVTMNVLSLGSNNAQVKTLQRILYARNIRDDAGRVITVDGAFGANTKAAVIKLQKQLFPTDSAQWDGTVGQKTWQAMLTQLW